MKITRHQLRDLIAKEVSLLGIPVSQSRYKQANKKIQRWKTSYFSIIKSGKIINE